MMKDMNDSDLSRVKHWMEMEMEMKMKMKMKGKESKSSKLIDFIILKKLSDKENNANILFLK